MRRSILLLIIVLIFSLSAFAGEEKWREAKTTHFIVYFKDVPYEFVSKVLDRSEYYYREITGNLGFTRYNFWLWDERAIIYIYDSKEEYIADTGQPAWSAGCASFREKVIKTYPLAAGFFDTLLPHELGHIIFREFVGISNRNIPLWLDEGVASYQEMSKRFAAKPYVRKAVREKRVITLDKLSDINLAATNDKEIIDLFYLESVTVVDFLIYYSGRSRFVRFCQELRDGKKLEQALSRVYNYRNLSELNDAWLRYLGR